MFIDIQEPEKTPHHCSTFSQEVGIDLGTTYTVVACVGPSGKPITLSLPFGVCTPSIVWCDASGTHHVGHADIHAPAVWSSTKRFMHEPLTPLLHTHETPVSIARRILHYVKIEAERILQKPITHAVITVPAYFDEKARQATKSAADEAGFTVMRLIAEPTAAALSYGLNHNKDGLYAVFDLGGGTFDFSLLRLNDHVFQVIGTGGDIHLGGDDVDACIAHNLGCSLRDARTLKEALSTHDAYTVHEHTLTHDQLHAWTQPLIHTCLSLCRQVMRTAEVAPSDIDGVVLVGGSTRLRAVRDAVTTFFEQTPYTDINPDECVAHGAAIHAHSLTEHYGALTPTHPHEAALPHLLLDVTPLSLGVETLGGIVDVIIPKNTPIPCHMAQDFTTAINNQKAIAIHIVQGDDDHVSNCQSLGKFSLSNLPQGPAHSVRVRVHFKLDENGLLSVSAADESETTESGITLSHMM